MGEDPIPEQDVIYFTEEMPNISFSPYNGSSPLSVSSLCRIFSKDEHILRRVESDV